MNTPDCQRVYPVLEKVGVGGGRGGGQGSGGPP